MVIQVAERAKALVRALCGWQSHVLVASAVVHKDGACRAPEKTSACLITKACFAMFRGLQVNAEDNSAPADRVVLLQ